MLICCHTQRRACNGDCAGRGAGIFFRVGDLFRTERGVACQGFVESDAENHVAALVAAVTDHVFPIFLVIVVLLLGPGLAGREIDCLRVARPGKGVDFVFA